MGSGNLLILLDTAIAILGSILKVNLKYLKVGKNQNNMIQDYWSSIVKGNSLYQMGELSHRMYLLNLLDEMGVKSVLDVGCGTGPIYELMAKYFYNYMKYKGVDPSPGMIESCQFNFPDGNWGVQNACNLKEGDGSFDCVLLMHSLDYIFDYQKAIQEAARVSKKYVLIVLWRSINYNPESEGVLYDPNVVKDNLDCKYATLQGFAIVPLLKAFYDAGLKLSVITNGEEINKEGKTNTLFLLEK